ncbi:MAG: molybdopterin-binding protein, partial [Halobacteria archaeon]|nr:molybdopterin-binding protein [Halobacteria archaeon]
MRVSIINVGDEILAGDTVNTNASWLASRLDERGVSVERMIVIPDDIDVIADTVSKYSDEYDAVIVTGGLGPTHDDITMDAVAEAFDTTVEPNDEALAQIREHYANADLVEGTADIPVGSKPIENTEGVAPGCSIGNVFVLLGVPSEMEAMFEKIEDEFEGEIRHSVFVYTPTPESALVETFEELRDEFDVSVGSYPQEGEVRIKISSNDEDELGEAKEWLDERLEELEGEYDDDNGENDNDGEDTQ